METIWLNGKEYRPTLVEDVVVSIPEMAFATARENKDIVPIKFKLCHEGANKKGDRFTRNELTAAQNTPLHKPIDWEHDEPVFGVMTNSALAEEANDGRMLLECEGILWKFKYPEFAHLVKNGYQEGSLAMSMECWFTDYDVVIGDYEHTVPEKEASIDLINCIGTELDGRFISRELKNVIFGGVGVTANPADPDAAILACASERSDEQLHEYLHKAFAGVVKSPMSEEQMVKEHERLHRKYSFMVVL